MIYALHIMPQVIFFFYKRLFTEDWCVIVKKSGNLPISRRMDELWYSHTVGFLYNNENE